MDVRSEDNTTEKDFELPNIIGDKHNSVRHTSSVRCAVLRAHHITWPCLTLHRLIVGMMRIIHPPRIEDRLRLVLGRLDGLRERFRNACSQQHPCKLATSTEPRP